MRMSDRYPQLDKMSPIDLGVLRNEAIKTNDRDFLAAIEARFKDLDRGASPHCKMAGGFSFPGILAPRAAALLQSECQGCGGYVSFRYRRDDLGIAIIQMEGCEPLLHEIVVAQQFFAS